MADVSQEPRQQRAGEIPTN